MKKTVTVPIEIDPEIFILQLADKLNYKEAIEIIKIIDDRLADWEFTKQVAAYFMNEIVNSWDDMGEPNPEFNLTNFLEENLRKTV